MKTARIPGRRLLPARALRSCAAALAVSAACVVMATTAGTASASPFQGGIVTLITPASPGSSFDNASRAVADGLARAWGVPVVVNARPGAATLLATSAAAKAAPDGRTILLSVTPTIQAPFLHAKLDYDPVTSFVPVAQMFDARLWLGINTGIPAKTVKEFVAAARAPDAKFAYSSPGNGSTPHLNASQLAQQAKVPMLHVPYKGVSPAVVDLASGQVQATFASYSDLVPHVQNGKVRVLASTGAERSPLSRDIPTMKEAGYANFEIIGFGGLVVPAGTPRPLVDEISRDVLKVLAQPEVKARLITLGFEPNAQGPEAFGQLLKVQSTHWQKVMRDAGVKPE